MAMGVSTTKQQIRLGSMDIKWTRFSLVLFNRSLLGCRPVERRRALTCRSVYRSELLELHGRLSSKKQPIILGDMHRIKRIPVWLAQHVEGKDQPLFTIYHRTPRCSNLSRMMSEVYRCSRRPET